jgi:membrane associated rhomboid family serine protease
VAETSPDVCYRHPQRESWVLCSRCGRTICPECQILTPSGVRCPDCVRETGGSVTWQSAGREVKRAPAKARRGRPVRSESASAEGSGFGATIGRMLRPGTEAPVLTWGVITIAVFLWVVGLFTVVPFAALAALPGTELQVWRFLTAPVVYEPGFVSVIRVALHALFIALTAPSLEHTLGRGRFFVLLATAAIISSAGMLLSGTYAAGLVGLLFAVFGAYLISVWSYPPARIQALVIIGINLLITLAVHPGGLPALVGGLIAGCGVLYLFQRYQDRSPTRTPYLIIAAVAGAFIVFAIVRSLI